MYRPCRGPQACVERLLIHVRGDRRTLFCAYGSRFPQNDEFDEESDCGQKIINGDLMPMLMIRIREVRDVSGPRVLG